MTLQTKEEIEKALIHYYKDLLIESIVEKYPAIHQVIQHIPSSISQDQNHSLSQNITMQEVEEAVMDMNPGKSPDPNGFTVDFF